MGLKIQSLPDREMRIIRNGRGNVGLAPLLGARCMGVVTGGFALLNLRLLSLNPPGSTAVAPHERRQAWWMLMLLVLSACAGSTEEQPASIARSPLSNATILVIRHAEKPEIGSGLSAEGQARAQAYVGYFQKFRLNSHPLHLDYLVAADDSEHSQRSRLTLEPLAQAIGLKPDVRFQAKQPEQLAQELQSRSHGQNILICWHHREIPELLKALGAEPGRLLPQGEWPSQQFGWMIELRYDHQGRVIQDKSRRIKEHLMTGD
jgi:hypothetical protein